MKNILLIALGGTIGSVKKDYISLDENRFKILDYYSNPDVKFKTVSPFRILSENMTIEYWRRLIRFTDSADIDNYDGVIILHGSDTLAYTAAIIGNAYPNKKIVITASDRPPNDEKSNAAANFAKAAELIATDRIKSPVVVFDGVFNALGITSARENDKFTLVENPPAPLCKKAMNNRNILIINPYVGINVSNYNFENADGVLFCMYHSATVPEEIINTSKTLEKMKIPYFFVTHRQAAEYETARDIKNILFSCTVENAYARMLLE